MGRLNCIALAFTFFTLGCGRPVPQDCANLAGGCGGDAVGTWAFSEGSCYALYGAGSGSGTLAMNGSLTLTLSASGDYTARGTGTDYVVTLPPSFFAPDAGTDCDTLKGDAASAGGSCSGGAAADCVCTYPVSSLDQTGTWATADTRMTFVRPAMTVRKPYCVAGSSLDLGWTFGNFFVVTDFTRQAP